MVTGVAAEAMAKETAPSRWPSVWERKRAAMLTSLGLVSTFPVYDIFQRYAFQVTCQVFTE
jgi:hypothetical protein